MKCNRLLTGRVIRWKVDKTRDQTRDLPPVAQRRSRIRLQINGRHIPPDESELIRSNNQNEKRNGDKQTKQ